MQQNDAGLRIDCREIAGSPNSSAETIKAIRYHINLLILLEQYLQARQKKRDSP